MRFRFGGWRYFKVRSYTLTLLDEIGTWRQTRYLFGKPYIEEYKKHFEDTSAPKDDYDDRNALYSM